MKWILLVGVLIGVANLTLASPLPRPPPLADPEAYFGDRESMDLLDRILGNVQDTASTTEKAELPKLIETTTSTTTTVPSTEGLEVSGPQPSTELETDEKEAAPERTITMVEDLSDLGIDENDAEAEANANELIQDQNMDKARKKKLTFLPLLKFNYLLLIITGVFVIVGFWVSANYIRKKHCK